MVRTEVEEEAEILKLAHRFEAAALAALRRDHPAEVADLTHHSDAQKGPKTPGPLRLGLRRLAREVGHVAALSAFKTADSFYWRIVLASERAIRWRASREEWWRHAPDHSFDGVFYWIGFQAVIRMEPGNVLFRTYFAEWVRSLAPRAPELRPLVHGRAFSRDRAQIQSLDMIRENQETGAAHLFIHELAAPDDETEARLVAADFLATVRPNLSPRSLEMLAEFTKEDGANNADVARRMGVSREYVRQRRNRLISECRQIAGLE